MKATDSCPCGAGAVYGACCLPLHVGEHEAETAEQLMRSRYSAIALGEREYVWRSWHPRTRPEEMTPRDEVEWTGLEVVDAVAGGAGDDHGEVEFRAHYRGYSRTGTLHERSRFAVRARRWFYVDGDVIDNRVS
ncbi:MAG: YchJ family protein [Mycobacterium sp.]